MASCSIDNRVPSFVRYVDADCARDLDDIRSTTGNVFTLGG